MMDRNIGARGSTFAAILLYILALLLFDLMGLVIKHLSPRFAAAELSAYRNIFGILPSAIALWWTASWHRAGRPMKIRQWRFAFARGAIAVAAQFMFYMSLGLMAFATATTISYSNALFMVAFAVPLLGERVGWIRWSAVLVGAFGVVLVMGIGRDGFSWVALLPAGAAAFYALLGITSRLIDEDVPSPLLNVYSSLSSAVLSIALVFVLFGFSPIASWQDAGWLLLMGCFGGSAVLILVVSFRMTEQSNLAPFSYFGIPLAFVLGWLFFGETPWGDLFPGTIFIVFGGLLVIWREQRLKAARGA